MEQGFTMHNTEQEFTMHKSKQEFTMHKTAAVTLAGQVLK